MSESLLAMPWAFAVLESEFLFLLFADYIFGWSLKTHQACEKTLFVREPLVFEVGSFESPEPHNLVLGRVELTGHLGEATH
jgi:hypothetical protein